MALDQDQIATDDDRAPLIDIGDNQTNNSTSDRTGEPVTRRTRMIIASCFAARILYLIGSVLIDIPLLQIQENILCGLKSADVLHPGLSLLPERDPRWRCKQEDVQSELSILQSWSIIAQLVPSLIVSVPLGLAADRYGRSAILGLGLLGVLLSYSLAALICAMPEVFNVRLSCLAPILTIFGGGEVMILTMLYAMLADVVPEDLRSLVFSYFFASMMIAGMLANPLAYIIMKASPWLSIYLGLLILALCIILCFALPETRKERPLTEVTSDHSEQQGNHVGVLHNSLEQARAGVRQLGNFLLRLAREERQGFTLLLSLLLTTFGKDAGLMLMQYITVKFHWEWSEAGLVLTIQQAVTLLLFTVFIPLATGALTRRGMSARRKDLWIVKLSGALQVAASVAVAFAPSPAVLISGVALSGLTAGYGVCMRSLMTSLLSNDIAMLYTLIGMFEILGTIAANPLLSASFRMGLKLGGVWFGLPYMIAGLLYTFAFCLIACMRISDYESVSRG